MWASIFNKLLHSKFYSTICNLFKELQLSHYSDKLIRIYWNINKNIERHQLIQKN